MFIAKKKHWELYPEMITSHVCKALTALSIAQHDASQCSSHLAELSLKSMKTFFRRIVYEWNTKTAARTSIGRTMSGGHHPTEHDAGGSSAAMIAAEPTTSDIFSWQNKLQSTDCASDRIEEFLKTMGSFMNCPFPLPLLPMVRTWLPSL